MLLLVEQQQTIWQPVVAAVGVAEATSAQFIQIFTESKQLFMATCFTILRC